MVAMMAPANVQMLEGFWRTWTYVGTSSTSSISSITIGVGGRGCSTRTSCCPSALRLCISSLNFAWCWRTSRFWFYVWQNPFEAFTFDNIESSSAVRSFIAHDYSKKDSTDIINRTLDKSIHIAQ